jgi:uncharacterized membrane protein YvbJ
MEKYFSCPNCGVDVLLRAKACPECGSDEQTGWSEAAKYIHLLPDTGDSEVKSPTIQRWQKIGFGAIAVFLVILIVHLSGFDWLVLPIVVVLILIGLSFFAVNFYRNSSQGMELQLYRHLVTRTQGDRQQVERLIDYESQRAPEANRLQLLQNAVYRWDRDRRL